MRLDKGRTIYNVGAPVRYALFPMNGMVALLATTEDADTLAVAMVGSDGVIGVPPFLPANTSPYDVIVQIPCDALRVSTDTLLHEFNRAEDLQRVLLDYPLCQDS